VRNVRYGMLRVFNTEGTYRIRDFRPDYSLEIVQSFSTCQVGKKRPLWRSSHPTRTHVHYTMIGASELVC
jgi:hypothetical protein